MARSGRHPPKAATVVIRAALVKEETGSAFHPRGCYTLTLALTLALTLTLTLTLTLYYTVYHSGRNIGAIGLVNQYQTVLYTLLYTCIHSHRGRVFKHNAMPP